MEIILFSEESECFRKSKSLDLFKDYKIDTILKTKAEDFVKCNVKHKTIIWCIKYLERSIFGSPYYDLYINKLAKHNNLIICLYGHFAHSKNCLFALQVELDLENWSYEDKSKIGVVGVDDKLNDIQQRYLSQLINNL